MNSDTIKADNLLVFHSGKGNIPAVKRLLNLGIKSSNEAIIYASENGHSKVVELLIKDNNQMHGNIYNGIKEAFIIACENNDTYTIRVFLNRCRCLPISVINKEFTKAYERNYYKVMKILLDFSIRHYNLEKILAKFDNDALLECAVETGNIELVKLLLEKNNNVNSYPSGKYMFSLATADNDYNLDIIKLLLENNFVEGDELYYECNYKGSRIELVKLLLKYLKPSTNVTYIIKCIKAAINNGNRDVADMIISTVTEPCIICKCLNESKSSFPIKLHCKHFYHPSCIKEWVNVSKKVNCCACTQTFTLEDYQAIYTN